MSRITPQSITAGLAGNVSKESTSGQEFNPEASGLPGAFPETPADEITGFSVNPIPETPGIGNPISLAPGEKVPDPRTLTSNTIASTARDDISLAKSADDPQQTFGVSPLPATSGIGNPIKLGPGEKVPPSDSFTQNTINTFVTTDEESYNKGSGAPQLPNVVTPQDERNNRENSLFSLPAISGSMIPESSLPLLGTSKGEQDPGVTIQSAGPNSSTAALAGQVPLEPRGIPQVIPRDPQDDEASEQQRKPGPTIQSSGPNSSTAALAGQVPLEPRAGGSSSAGRDRDVNIQSVGPSSTTAKLAGEVPLEPPITPRGIAEKRRGGDPDGGKADDVTIQSVGANATTAGLAGNVPLEPRIPPRGTSDSQQRSDGQEGDRFRDATIQSAGANASTAGLAGNVPLEPRNPPKRAPKDHQGGGDSQGGGPGNFTIQSAGANATTAGLAGNVPFEPRGVPEIVQESQQAAGFAPEASANAEALREKAELEKELESKVPEEPPTSEGIGGVAAGVASLTSSTGAGSTSLPSRGLPTSVLHSIDEINKGSAKGPSVPGAVQDSVSRGTQGIAIAPTVPDVVQESIVKAHQSPEAAASTILVDERKAVESELLSHVKLEEAVGEPAPSASAALSGKAPAPTKDLGHDVAAADATSRGPGQSALAEATQNRHDSRDISPMSHPVGGSRGPQTGPQTVPPGPQIGSQTVPQTGPQTIHQTAPQAAPQTASQAIPQPMPQLGPSVTTGVATSSTPQKSRAEPIPASSSRPTQATSEASASSDKRSKRASGFFGKLKHKFSHKD
jgi:hypothetical protein